MPTVEQVSKRLFSDSRWFVKVFIGGLLMLLPTVITQILAFGYLYRLFLQGKDREAFALPEWEDWRGFLTDGVKVFVIGLVYCVGPFLAMFGLTMLVQGHWLMGQIPLIPVIFLSGPASCAALYLFSLRSDLKDAMNFGTVWIMLKRGAFRYSGPTLALVGLGAVSSVLAAFTMFFGATIYVYFMAAVFKDLENSR